MSKLIFFALGTAAASLFIYLRNRWLIHQYNKSLERDVAKFVSASIQVREGRIDAEAEMKFDPKAGMRIAKALASLLLDAPNYMEIKFDAPRMLADAEWITVTVQRSSGKTPGELHREAKTEIGRLRKQLESENNG